MVATGKSWTGGQAARWLVAFAMVIAGAFCAGPALAQELLANRSFETPVAPQGNNLYTTLPSWTLANVSPPQSQPVNIVRPYVGLGNNPEATPTGGGSQYLDIASASGTIKQTVSLGGSGTISIGGWFSVRDFQQALSGCNVLVRNGGGTIVASATTSFTAGEPIGLWKHASVSNISLPAGTYTFEADVPNFANIDLVSMVVTYPPVTVTKTSSALTDPVNAATNPKLIPGAVVAYAIGVTAPSNYSVTSNSLALIDPTPANAALMVNDLGGGTGPIVFNGASSGLTVAYTSLTNPTDGISFSADGGTTWNYAPTQGANGSDPLITHVRILPQGSMASSSNFVLTLRYRVK